MDIRELYTNPEVKKITKKYFVITLIGSIVIMLSSFAISKSINNDIFNNNISFFAGYLKGNDEKQLIQNFYTKKSKKEENNAKNILKQYGYDENLSRGTNTLFTSIYFRIFIPILIIFLFIVFLLYLVSINQLRSIYKDINKIINQTRKITDGKYNKIDGEYSEGEISSLISSVNYMGDRVNNSIDNLTKEKNQLKDFLSDISHQLKTPLSSLIMFNDIMRTKEDMSKEDRDKFLKKSDEQLQRMEWLIMVLLKVGRLEAGAVNFEIQKQPIKYAIKSAVTPFIEAAKKENKDILVKGDIDAAVPHDKYWMAEAISNIVKNAVEHTECGGKIEIEVEKGKLITKIYIRDNGKGMTEEVRKNIFKRFYKGDKNIDPKSIGIGLSLTKSIIEKQGGQIVVNSELNKGTSFIISFIEKM